MNDKEEEMKKSIALLLVLALVIVAPAFSAGQREAEEDTLSMRVAGISPEDYRSTQGLYRIKDAVESGTDGRIELDVFPMNQLGDYTQVFEEIRRGTIEMGLIFIPSQFDVKLELGSLPYLADDAMQLMEVLSPGSYVFDSIYETLDGLGVKLLRINGEGFIGIGATKRPAAPLDPTVDKDMLIRAAPLAVYTDTAGDLGYRTTTIPYADTYSAIQTGVVDGWIGGSANLNYHVFRDVIDYYIPYNALFDQTAFLINKDLWESLSAADQDVIMAAVNAEADKSFVDSANEDEEYMDMMRAEGIEIIEITDAERAVLAEHVRENTWPNFVDKFGQATLDRVLDSVQ
jgi:TRAP-type transport system periplasmic protein